MTWILGVNPLSGGVEEDEFCFKISLRRKECMHVCVLMIIVPIQLSNVASSRPPQEENSSFVSFILFPS